MMETRIHVDGVECRSTDDAAGLFVEGSVGVISGYAAVFKSRSEDLGGFIEEIAPGAFDAVLGDDVRGLVNHSNDLILGRTTANTMKLEVDDVGLRYTIAVPDTTVGRDLMVSLGRRDVTGSSFGFTVQDDEWRNDGGRPFRVIHRVNRLYDVGPVTYPAYTATTASVYDARTLEKVREMTLPPTLWKAELRHRAAVVL